MTEGTEAEPRDPETAVPAPAPAGGTRGPRTAEEAKRFAEKRISLANATPRRILPDPLQSEVAWAFRVEADDPVVAEAYGLLVVDKYDGRVEQWLATEDGDWPERYVEERAGRQARARARRSALPRLIAIGLVVAAVIAGAFLVFGKYGVFLPLTLGLVFVGDNWRRRFIWSRRLRRGLTAAEAERVATGRIKRLRATPRAVVGEPRESPSAWAFETTSEDPLARAEFGLLVVDKHDGWVEQWPRGAEEGWEDRYEVRRERRRAAFAASRRSRRRFIRRVQVIAILVILVILGAALVLGASVPATIGTALVWLALIALPQVLGGLAGEVKTESLAELTRARRVALEPAPTSRSRRAPGASDHDLLEPLAVVRERPRQPRKSGADSAG